MEILKVHVRICCIANFHDLKLSATKMAAVSMQCKIPNENFFYYRFNKAFVKKFMNKISLFNRKSWNLFEGLVFCQTLQSPIFCY